MMPLPYAHFVLAQRIAEAAGLPVVDEGQYLLGAFLPDIRYFTGQNREHTHFPLQELDRYQACSDVSVDFLRGYKVHLLIDEVWEEDEVKTAYRRAFLPPIRKRMTRGLEALVMELYCLKQPVPMVKLPVAENSVTRQLSLERSALEISVHSAKRYLERRDLAAALEMAREMKLFPSHRVRTLEQLLSVMRHPLLGRLVMAEVIRSTGPTFKRVIHRVRERLEGEAS
jgi:hypothetical protein